MFNVLSNSTRCSYIKKKNSGDEFLVEKKSPLVMPPEYGKLPSPTNNQANNNVNEDSIENLISSDKKNIITKKDQQSDKSSIEKRLLEKIK